MARLRRSSLRFAPVLAGGALAFSASIARAAGPGATEPPDARSESASEDGPGFGDPSENAPATIRSHAYTLTECLALADRNFPNLWAARARLALAHAQLDEAKWVPFWQWNASSNLTVLGAIGGTPIYTATGQTAR